MKRSFVFLFFTFIVIGQLTDVSAETAVQKIPAEVVYGHLFRQIAYLEAKTREIEGKPVAEDSLRTFLKRQLALSDDQNRVVFSVATECEHAVGLIDERALIVINALRLNHNVAGQSPRERTRQEFQLRKMQVERKDVILIGRKRLAKALGTRDFTEFDNFVMRSVGANIARQTTHTDRGYAHGYTQLWYDRDAFMAIGYSATELDYTAQIYYDAYVLPLHKRRYGLGKK